EPLLEGVEVLLRDGPERSVRAPPRPCILLVDDERRGRGGAIEDRRRPPRSPPPRARNHPACRGCRTRRSASRAEEDAPPVALDGYERARAHAREPPDVPPAREDVGPGAVVEEHAEGPQPRRKRPAGASTWGASTSKLPPRPSKPTSAAASATAPASTVQRPMARTTTSARSGSAAMPTAARRASGTSAGRM